MKRLLHALLGWAVPDGRIGGDGYRRLSRCAICNRLIERDGIGVWFHRW